MTALPIFVNRKIILQFLKSLLVPGADNQLEKFLWRVLSCNEMTALLRVNTLWKYIFSEPARWLSGKATKGLKDWSIDRSSGVLDLVEKAMVAVAADGHTLLDPAFDPFASVAAEQPAFRKWRERQQLRTAKAPDGSEHLVHAKALSEARSPAGAGNAQATERVVALAEKMANAALIAMRDPRRAICSLLTSQEGAFSMGKDEGKHAATAGAHVTNCRVESNFGCTDILMRMYRCAAPAPLAPAHPCPPCALSLLSQALPAESARGDPASHPRERPPTGPHRPVVTFPPFNLSLPTIVPRPPSQVLDRREHLRHGATDAQPGL